MLIEIFPDDYKKCAEAARNFWSSSKGGKYGRGILNSESDPYRTERIGLLGEMALGRFLNVDVKFAYKKHGDAYDFLLHDRTIDIKTASRNYGSILIQYKNSWNKIVFKKKDIYVGAYLVEDTGETASIELAGYILGNIVAHFTPVKSPIGKWWNLEVPLDGLQDIVQLREFSEGKLNWHGLYP